MIDWNELSRPAQNALVCLYGGGSLANSDPEVVSRLQELDLIDGNDRRKRLSSLGWAFMDFTHAQLKARMNGDQQADQPGDEEQEIFVATSLDDAPDLNGDGAILEDHLAED